MKLNLPVEIRRHSEAAPWSYADLDERQRALREEGGGILLSEVSPVITKGKRTPESDLFWTRQQYRERSIEVLEVDRGGLATWHGPGQWVLFVVTTVEALTGKKVAVREAVERLLTVGLRAGKVLEPRLEIRHMPYTGLWSPRGKVGSLGIRIEKGWILHGLSINGFQTPESFLGLNPCGLSAQMDYLLPSKNESEFEALGERLVAEALAACGRSTS